MNDIASSPLSKASRESRARRQPGGATRYGLPCANCRLYYAAELTACPICHCGDRISPATIFVSPAARL